MKTFVGTVKSRNGKRAEERIQVEDETATDPVKRAQFISSRQAIADISGKVLVNWKFED